MSDQSEHSPGPVPPSDPTADGGLSRRGVLRAAAAGALGIPLGAALAGAAPAGAASASAAVPSATAAHAAVPAAAPELPAGLRPYRSPYINWAGEITHSGLWACAPRTGQDLAELASWAHANGWRLRARGKSHTWSPLTITGATEPDARVLLLDTTKHLTHMELTTPPAGAPGAVRAQTGVLLETLLAFLADHGLGVTNTPAPGELTLGGTLAIDAHGTSVPANGEPARPGHTYGSLSNLVLSLTAVVWDPDQDAYVVRTFDRGTDEECEALATHLGAGSRRGGRAPGGRGDPAALSEPRRPHRRRAVRRPGQRPRRPGKHLRRLHGRVGAGGDDLVRLHRQALAQGVEPQP